MQEIETSIINLSVYLDSVSYNYFILNWNTIQTKLYKNKSN
jgi:hypothetical protein